MGLASLINERNLSGGDFGIDYEPSSIIDVTKASFNATIDNYLTTSAWSLQSEQIDNQYNLIQKIEKQSLEQIIGDETYNSDDRYKKTDEWILSKRTQDPLYNDIPTTSEMRLNAEKKAKDSFLELEQVKKGANGLESFFGELAGGVGASVFDPVNIAVAVGSMGVGAVLNTGRAALQTAGRIILTEAAIGAGAEVVMQPFVTGWQQQVGNEYGLGDAAANIAFAGLVSGGIAGITTIPLKKSIENTRNKGSVFFETIATSERTPEQIKPIMEKMADYARVKETNPFEGVQGSKVHADNVKLVEDAFNKRETFGPIFPDDIEMRFKTEMNKIDLDFEPYLLQARQIKQDIKTEKVFDINSPQSFKKELGYTPETLSQFIKNRGGVKDSGGEIRSIDSKLPALITKKNKKIHTMQGVFEVDTQIDSVKQAAFDEGYFPNKANYDEITNDEFFDALKMDLDGNKVYKFSDFEKINDLNTGASLKDQYDQIGITPNMSDIEIANALRDKDILKNFDASDVYFKEKIKMEDSFDQIRETSYYEVSNDKFDLPEEEMLPRDYRAIESPSDELIDTIQRVERNEFDDLIKEDPNFTITMDDGTKIRILDIMNDVQINEKINDAIKVCSI